VVWAKAPDAIANAETKVTATIRERISALLRNYRRAAATYFLRPPQRSPGLEPRNSAIYYLPTIFAKAHWIAPACNSASLSGHKALSYKCNFSY
jgi:hypothetical protein